MDTWNTAGVEGVCLLIRAFHGKVARIPDVFDLSPRCNQIVTYLVFFLICNKKEIGLYLGSFGIITVEFFFPNAGTSTRMCSNLLA